MIVRYEGYEGGLQRAFQIHGFVFTSGLPSETIKSRVHIAIAKVQHEATRHYLTLKWVGTKAEVNKGSKLIDEVTFETVGDINTVIVRFTDEEKGYWEETLYREHFGD